MPTNLYDPSVIDYSTYFRYQDHRLGSLNISNSGTNRSARFFCQKNTLYHVSLLMDTRFRIAGYAVPHLKTIDGSPTDHYVVDELDVNGSNSVRQIRTMDFRTNDTDTVIIIFYWTTGGSISVDDVRNSITITVDEEIVPPIITVGEPSRTIISDEPGYDKCICTFSPDQDLIRWEARATLVGVIPQRGIGIIVESGTVLTAGTIETITIDDEEITNGDGEYVVTVYGLSSNGYWSDGSREVIE